MLSLRKIIRSWNFPQLWMSFLLFLTVFANFIANDKPLYARYKNRVYFPVVYDLLYELNLYQWEEELLHKDWKALPLESAWWAIIPFSPEQLDMQNAPASPPLSVLKIRQQLYYHFLGTDELGRDIASGLVYGARYTIFISFLSTFIATLVGVFIGAVAGFWGDYDLKISRYTLIILLTFGSWTGFICFYSLSYALKTALATSFILFLIKFLFSIALCLIVPLTFWKLFSFLPRYFPSLSKKVTLPIDLIISRLIEIKLSIPILLLVIILTAIAKPSILLLILIIAFSQWTLFARLVRAEILKIKHLEYVSVARTQGFMPLWILWKHVLPNALPPVGVAIAFAIAAGILIESALSFLGLANYYVSWGALLKSGRYDLQAWWLILFPGLMIFLTIFALNRWSETLRKKLNPKKL